MNPYSRHLNSCFLPVENTIEPIFISFTFPTVKQVKIVFGTRLGGVSHNQFNSLNVSLEVGDDLTQVLQNRSLIKKKLKFELWNELIQVHGTTIYSNLDIDCFSQPVLKGDGLFTSHTNTGLIIKTADCQAIFFTDLEGKYLGAIHCGWRGNIAEFPLIAAKAFAKQFNIPPENIFAVRGPSLGPCCSTFTNYPTEIPKKYWSFISKSSKKLNLWELTKYQLLQAGLLPQNIFELDICTRCNPHLFFSYRYNRICGRNINLIYTMSQQNEL
ncbi:MAG: polyphenol oxidase family protein [Desulfonauticus sp.]|nr:polyphenol oxidase family protein [Desulfonauticus sp.]